MQACVFWILRLKELSASYVYLSLCGHFERDDVALKGFAQFFKKNSDEERDHAQKLINYQNLRGGKVVLGDVKVRFDQYTVTLMPCLLKCVINSILIYWSAYWRAAVLINQFTSLKIRFFFVLMHVPNCCLTFMTEAAAWRVGNWTWRHATRIRARKASQSGVAGAPRYRIKT